MVGPHPRPLSRPAQPHPRERGARRVGGTGGLSARHRSGRYSAIDEIPYRQLSAPLSRWSGRGAGRGAGGEGPRPLLLFLIYLALLLLPLPTRAHELGTIQVA